MNNKMIYEDEKRNWLLYILPIAGIIIMVYITILRIINPGNYKSGGYIVSLVFMIFWTLITFLFTYFGDIKPRKKFKLFKQNSTKYGNRLSGKIVDVVLDVISYVNGKPNKFRYYAEVEVEGKSQTIKSHSLLINPKNCETNDVTVYEYNGEYLVTDFKFKENTVEELIKKEKEEVEYYNESSQLTTWQKIKCLIVGTIITIITVRAFINAADKVIRIIIIPFIIAGIGVLLEGLLPLVFPRLQKYTKDIGKKISMAGLLLFWFALLIVCDYIAIRDGQFGMVIYSLLFWIVGIFMLITNFKKKK